MRHQATSLLGNEGIGITFTDKAITPWGGLVIFSGLARQIGLEAVLRQALPFKLTSPNATDSGRGRPGIHGGGACGFTAPCARGTPAMG